MERWRDREKGREERKNLSRPLASFSKRSKETILPCGNHIFQGPLQRVTFGIS
jgi:hypothetical protein